MESKTALLHSLEFPTHLTKIVDEFGVRRVQLERVIDRLDWVDNRDDGPVTAEAGAGHQAEHPRARLKNQ